MPDPERLLTTLRRATLAFRETPGRTGRLIHLQGSREVLVAGDLHGNVENFRRVLRIADLAQRPDRHLVLQEVIHGDFSYPDGGDKSHQLLDLLATLKVQFPRQVHFLLGNHELAQALNRPIAKGDANLNQQFRLGIHTAYGSRADEVYAHYIQMLAVVPVAVRTPNRVFLSHSLPPASRMALFDPAALERDESAEADLLPRGSIHGLLWGRDTSQANVADFLQRMDADLLISGHIPCDQGFAAPNDRQLILDTLGVPAACCLFSTERPLTHAELVGGVIIL
jgi:hypothetical protein